MPPAPPLRGVLTSNAQDASWLEKLLFDESSWASVGRPSAGATDQATLLATAKAAGLRATTVAAPRAGVSIYTNAPQSAPTAARLLATSGGGSGAVNDAKAASSSEPMN